MVRMMNMIAWVAALALPLGAQDSLQAEVNFSMETFEILTKNDGTQQVLSYDTHYFYPSNVRLPALPKRTIRVLVPNGARLVGFTSTFYEEIVAEDFNPSSAPLLAPTNHFEAEAPGKNAGRIQSTESGPFPVQSSKNSNWKSPDEVVRYGSTHVGRGFTWFSFIVSPFRYNTDSRKLYLVKKLKLKISYVIDYKNRTVVRPGSATEAYLRTEVVNPEDLDNFYPRVERTYLKSAENQVDYLILTSEELKPAFEPLLEWKFRKGLKVKVTTIEEIKEVYDDSSVQMKIKKYLKELYDACDLTWVLIGGDHTVVPPQECFTKAKIDNKIIIDNTVPADLFYACLDGNLNWNSNNDNYIGQLNTDSVDLSPELHITRIPLRTRDQARAIVNKILAYEQDQPVSGFADHLLMSGVKLGIVSNGKSDAHFKSENFYNNYILPFWSGERDYLYDTGTSFPEDSACDVTVSKITELLNEGYGIFLFTGHGNPWWLNMETGPNFNTEYARALNHPLSGVMIFNSCEVGRYDDPETCLAEALIQNPDGGCVALFGSSRLGIEYKFILGPTFSYAAEFFQKLFSDRPGLEWHSFGTAATLAKEAFSDNTSYSSGFPYLQYALCPIGDPEMPIFTEAPMLFDKAKVDVSGHLVTVHTGGVKNSRICLTSLNIKDGYQEVAENVLIHSFETGPEDFQVTITAPNYIPFVYQPTGIAEKIDSYFRLFPNPANDQVTLRIPSDGLYSITITTLHGKTIQMLKVAGGEHIIDLSSWSNGIYLITIRSDEVVMTEKFIKQGLSD